MRKKSNILKGKLNDMRFLPVLPLLFLLITSCQKDDTEVRSPDYFPLATGNFWEYSDSSRITVLAPTLINDTFYYAVQHRVIPLISTLPHLDPLPFAFVTIFYRKDERQNIFTRLPGRHFDVQWFSGELTELGERTTTNHWAAGVLARYPSVFQLTSLDVNAAVAGTVFKDVREYRVDYQPDNYLQEMQYYAPDVGPIAIHRFFGEVEQPRVDLVRARIDGRLIE